MSEVLFFFLCIYRGLYDDICLQINKEEKKGIVISKDKVELRFYKRIEEGEGAVELVKACNL